MSRALDVRELWLTRGTRDILRGVNLLGIDSVQTPITARRAMWNRIGGDLRPSWLATLDTEVVGLENLAPQLDRILVGGMRGRVLVNPSH
mgnify:CR=1 FL=1